MGDAPVNGWGLGAAESLALRDGAHTDAVDALRLAVTELIVRGAARIDQVPAGRRGRRTESRISRVRPVGAAAPPSVTSVDRALDRLLGGPAPIPDLARTLVGSSNADRWLQDIVVAGLVDRGLLAVERAKVLGIVPRTRVMPTANGELERARLLGHLAALAAVPGDELRDPLPVIVAAGTSVLLVREVWPRLASVQQGAVPWMADGAAAGGWDGPGPDAGIDLGGLGDLDLGVLDGLDSAFDGIGLDIGGADGGGGDAGGGG